MISFAIVAVAFNMANRNLAKKSVSPKRKTHKQALKDWEEFKKKHPSKSKKAEAPD